MNGQHLVGEIIHKDDPMEAIILKAKEVENGHIILCFAPLRKEFISWYLNNDNATNSGQYFMNLDDALIHFKARN